MHYALCNTFRLVQNGRDVSMQGHCVSRPIHLWGPGSQKIPTGTHRFGTSRHPPCSVIHCPIKWILDKMSLEHFVQRFLQPNSYVRGLENFRTTFPRDIASIGHLFQGLGIPECLLKVFSFRDVPLPHGKDRGIAGSGREWAFPCATYCTRYAKVSCVLELRDRVWAYTTRKRSFPICEKHIQVVFVQTLPLHSATSKVTKKSPKAHVQVATHPKGSSSWDFFDSLAVLSQNKTKLSFFQAWVQSLFFLAHIHAGSWYIIVKESEETLSITREGGERGANSRKWVH